MKHQEWLIDMNFYQARNSLLEQAISKKNRSVKQVVCIKLLVRKNRCVCQKHLSSTQVLFSIIYTCLLKTFRLILLLVLLRF